MKRGILTMAMALTLLASCTENKSTESQVPEALQSHPEWGLGATIYELNTRQLTPEGTFVAAQNELPRLKELGVDIIWMMPIQPIGLKERKGTLGSYYAISDYTGFNPEFGTREDFESFVAEAHSLGMKVILDWVANHTSPDHKWASHKNWHKRDSLGEMKVKYDWTDITELEYDNKNMRAAMKSDMMFWADTIGVDGFRCDMAMLVPIDFWEESVGEIREKHPEFFMLAEAEEGYLVDSVFNAYYGWDLHHTLNALAQGKITADSLGRQLEKTIKEMPARAQRLNFTSNHDENSWAGSAVERMGDALPVITDLTFMLPGVPLIYSGQELGNAKRLEFFEKDTVDMVENSTLGKEYKRLIGMRKAHPALRYGDFTILKNSEPQRVFAMERTAGDDRVVAVFNFSPESVVVEVETTNENAKKIELKGYSSQIFEK